MVEWKVLGEGGLVPEAFKYLACHFFLLVMPLDSFGGSFLCLRISSTATCTALLSDPVDLKPAHF